MVKLNISAKALRALKSLQARGKAAMVVKKILIAVPATI